MKIKTITCHEVYNYGASLQEHALLKFLESLGHDAEAIHYKPHYLGNNFNFWAVSPRYENNIVLRGMYLLFKFPRRYRLLKRKENFDLFSRKYILSTSRKYTDNDDLRLNLPDADAYICGSDQIWNSFFHNGKDPAFYLDFVPRNKLKISYAASFAIDDLEDDIKGFVREKVSRLNKISVRESSGKRILSDLGIYEVTHVLDPVFLLDQGYWLSFCDDKVVEDDYIFVYDFDSNPLIESFAKLKRRKYGYKIVSVNPNIRYADSNFYLEGPKTFLTLLANAKFVVSNSFHAIAFSSIFKKQFVVFNRFEKINTRMIDFVSLFQIEDVIINDRSKIEDYNYTIDFDAFDMKLTKLVKKSREYLIQALEN